MAAKKSKAKPRTKGAAAERDSEPEPMPARAVAKQATAPGDDGDGDPYTDQDSEWEDVRYGGGEEHPTTRVFTDFTGGDKGISGKTDVTKAQFAFLWTLRNMEKDFRERGMLGIANEIKEGALWFETYRLSIDRKSRVESVDILRGRLEMMPKPDEQASSPLRFN